VSAGTPGSAGVDAWLVVVEQDGGVRARTVTGEANHAWVRGLRPGTTYGYRVLVDGESWTARHGHDWTPRAWLR